MFVASLNQSVVVVGLDEVFRLPANELSGWNILSIRGRMNERPLNFPAARRVKTLHFDDVEADHSDYLFAATPKDIEDAIAFGREVGEEPLLIHCHAGISRSTAAAWIIIWDKLKNEPDAVQLSFDIVRKLRPILLPNRHVLRLGIEALAPKETQKRILQQFQECLVELNYPHIEPPP
jgi:predicted protein tyrosine phosphatase